MAFTENALKRLEARGLDAELADKLGFDSETRRWPQEVGDGKTNWHDVDTLVIPFYRKGQVVRRKFKAWDRPEGSPAYLQEKGGQRIAWNEDALRDDTLLGQPLIITEGELDALAAIQAQFPRTISAPDGAPEKPIENAAESEKYAWLMDDGIADLLKRDRVPEIIIASDGDEAGGVLLHDLSHLLGRFRCKYLVYPLAPEKARAKLGRARCKDLNEVLQFYGVKGVQKTIAGAQFVKVKGLYRMSELPPLPKPTIYQNHRLERFGRDHYKVRLGDFAVITAMPGMGKTTWANDFYCQLALEHGLRIAWASFEQTPQRDHRRALRCWYGKPDPDEPFGRKGCRLKEMSPTQIADADAWIDEYHRFIVPDEDDDVTLEWMLEKMEAAVVQHGCKIIVIDPWNEMDHTKDRHESLTEYVGRAIKTFKKFAKKFQIHLVVIAHPSKPQRDVKTGEYRIPSLYDISDSAHWFNKSDVGIVVHKPKELETMIRTQKSKYWDVIGTPGDVIMMYSDETRRYTETGPLS